MSVKSIATDNLRHMKDSEGLIIQGCGGYLDEWVEGINQMLTESEILLDGTQFENASTFEHDKVTCLLFPFENGVKLDMGNLALWRLQTHENFGGTWLSDYIPNRLGGFLTEYQTEQKIGEDNVDCRDEDIGREKSILFINAKRNGYAPDQCGKTMTVGELMSYLEDFDSESKIYLSHDNGYTYGSISERDFEESEDLNEEENRDEGMDMAMIVTFPGMAAQQESVSISGNMRWSYKKRMESGDFNCCCPAYGFDLKDAQLTINEEQSEIIRRIFSLYL